MQLVRAGVHESIRIHWVINHLPRIKLLFLVDEEVSEWVHLLLVILFHHLVRELLVRQTLRHYRLHSRAVVRIDHPLVILNIVLNSRFLRNLLILQLLLRDSAIIV